MQEREDNSNSLRRKDNERRICQVLFLVPYLFVPAYC